LSLSILGILLVSNLFTSAATPVDWLGIAVGLTTAVFFAAYIVLSEKISPSQETIGVMLKGFAIASLFWIAYQLTQGIPWTIIAPQNILNVSGLSNEFRQSGRQLPLRWNPLWQVYWHGFGLVSL
jgi:drug/metabolite transporter, DME family